MTVEMSVNGRPVYTLAQLAQLSGQKPEALLARVAEYEIEPAGHAEDQTPLYFGDDPFLGIKRVMWTLEADIAKGELQELAVELGLGFVGVTEGRYSTVSAMGWTAAPPSVLETLAQALRKDETRLVELHRAAK